MKHQMSKVSIISALSILLVLQSDPLRLNGCNRSCCWAIKAERIDDEVSSRKDPASLMIDDEAKIRLFMTDANIALAHDDDKYLEHAHRSYNNKNIRKNHPRDDTHDTRYLRDGEGAGLLTTRTFPECVEQKLSAKECQEYIEQQIEDAGGHEVGDDIQVKIRTPRTEEQFAESYWMVELPVNVYDIVACDYNKGSTYYPFKWKDDITGEELDVEDQFCYGYGAADCCLELRKYGKRLTESGYDVNKQCLSCFVHREPLEPIKNEITGNVDFLGYQSDPDGCIQEQFTGEELDALDKDTLTYIGLAIRDLELFEKDRSCFNFENNLLRKLYGAASVIHPLSMKIGQFACSICYGKHDLDLDDPFISNLIGDMLDLMKQYLKNPKSSKEKCIIIHTSSEGEIVQDPTFGSGRSNSPNFSTAEEFGPCHYKCPDGYYCGLQFGEYDCIENACVQDPTLCSETEFCSEQYPDYYEYIDMGFSHPFPKSDPHYECLRNPCVISPPEECQRGTLTCVPLDPDDSLIRFYVCLGADCEEDPSVCADDEFCDYRPDIRNKYQCRPITCRQDPTMCSDFEWCDERTPSDYYNEYYEDNSQCRENVCVTNPPEDCQDENDVCVPTYDGQKNYECKEQL